MSRERVPFRDHVARVLESAGLSSGDYCVRVKIDHSGHTAVTVVVLTHALTGKVAIGVARQNPVDTFSRATGRRRAFSRALGDMLRIHRARAARMGLSPAKTVVAHDLGSVPPIVKEQPK